MLVQLNGSSWFTEGIVKMIGLSLALVLLASASCMAQEGMLKLYNGLFL